MVIDNHIFFRYRHLASTSKLKIIFIVPLLLLQPINVWVTQYYTQRLTLDSESNSFIIIINVIIEIIIMMKTIIINIISLSINIIILPHSMACINV
jgi:hypothetical protein